MKTNRLCTFTNTNAIEDSFQLFSKNRIALKENTLPNKEGFTLIIDQWQIYAEKNFLTFSALHEGIKTSIFKKSI